MNLIQPDHHLVLEGHKSTKFEEFFIQLFPQSNTRLTNTAKEHPDWLVQYSINPHLERNWFVYYMQIHEPVTF